MTTFSIPSPAQLLQRLIKFNTTNPPGNERACVEYIRDVLTAVGIESTLYAKSPERPNLYARLQGQGKTHPLLLYGHVDVVTTQNQVWEHPPFEANIIDDMIWGRGALDMKSGVAMMVSAFIRAKQRATPPPGDVILVILSDEEASGNFGAKYLAEAHPDLFEGVKYALGEFGGFTFYLGGKKFYPIQTNEKQQCHVRVTIQGTPGHGSMPVQNGAMAKAAKFLTQLDRRSLPVHIAPTTRAMFTTLAAGLSFPSSLVIRQLLNPALTNLVLELLGEQARTLSPLLHNTVSPTIIHGSDKLNVIPGEVTIDLDGRILPGLTPDVLLEELQPFADDSFTFEVRGYNPGPSHVNMTLFPVLADILHEADREGIATPLLLAAVTDGRFFARLGIQTYGFTPMKLPPGFNFSQTIHAANERIPVDSVEFGTQAISQALQRFGEIDSK